MFCGLVLIYGSTWTTLSCLTQYARVKLAISRRLSTSLPRALPRSSSNIEWDEVQGNEDFLDTNGTPDLKLTVINDTQIDVLSLAKILGVNISSDRKWSHNNVEVDQKAGERLFFLSQLKRAGLGPNELVQFYPTYIRPITEYACPVFTMVYLYIFLASRGTVQKTAMRVVFPCFLYEEAFVKTSLVTLSDRRQARLRTNCSRKDCKLRNLLLPQNANRYNLIKARQFNSVFKTHIST